VGQVFTPLAPGCRRQTHQNEMAPTTEVRMSGPFEAGRERFRPNRCSTRENGLKQSPLFARLRRRTSARIRTATWVNNNGQDWQAAVERVEEGVRLSPVANGMAKPVRPPMISARLPMTIRC
jgi:hypothetical protein